MIELMHVKCALCGEDKEALLMKAKNTHGSRCISGEKFNLVRCKKCGLVYVNPRPNQDEIGKFYETSYYSTGNRLKTWAAGLLIYYSNLQQKALITRYVEGGKILDIGCGRGDFLSSFNKDNKWALFGVEPNKEGFSLSINKVKGKIFNDELINCKFAKNYFDVITMGHVFEHLYYPNEQLQEVHRVLKDDGIFVLSVPNIKSFGFKLGKEHWFHLDCPRHLYHFHSKTIYRMLNKNGFSVLKIDFPCFGFLLDLYYSLLNRFENKFVRISLMFPFLLSSLLLKPLCSLVGVSETMRIICRKKV